MAFPTVAATNGGYDGTGTSHTVNLPSGIVAGDLLIVFFDSYTNLTVTFPSGWTKLFDGNSGTYGQTLVCYYRVADGTEGSTIAVTTSASEPTAHTSYRITGYSGAPTCGTLATGTNTNPDPPSCSPGWGAQDILWIAVCGAAAYVTAAPSGFGSFINEPTYSQYLGNIGSAQENYHGSYLNPGTFTINGSASWCANTVAIRPAAAPKGAWGNKASKMMAVNMI